MSIDTVFTVDVANHSIRFIDSKDDLLYFGTFYGSDYSSYIYETDLKDYTKRSFSCTTNPQDLIVDDNNDVWISSDDRNIVYLQE
ncbi:MAG: hypothetical protein R2771_09985 [Saprospiraceae bacterium]